MQVCCHRKMGVSKYVLTYNIEFIHREIYHYFCSCCGHERLFKRYIDKRGEIFKKEITGKKYVQEEMESLRTQILCNIISIGSWCKAKGFTYLKGYNYKNSSKGVILRYSDGKHEKKYHSPVIPVI